MRQTAQIIRERIPPNSSWRLIILKGMENMKQILKFPANMKPCNHSVLIFTFPINLLCVTSFAFHRTRKTGIRNDDWHKSANPWRLAVESQIIKIWFKAIRSRNILKRFSWLFGEISLKRGIFFSASPL